MKITRIKIENFRSIRKTEFNPTDFNIFVGQNNCGKTNFFEALEFFFNGIGKSGKIDDLKFRQQQNSELIVEVEFNGSLASAAQMQNQTNRTKIENALNGSDTVVIVKNSSAPKRKMIVNGIDVTLGTGIDPALNDFLPKFEYINTKKYYDSVAKYSKTTPIGIMLSGVLSTILQTNHQYQNFQQMFNELFENDDSEIKAQFESLGDKVKIHLERQFPDTSKVGFEISPPVFDDLLKNFDIKINDGIETLAEEKGDGMQRALMLAIIQTYEDFRKANDDSGKTFLFLIDEAELHLHPTAQRKLKDVLLSLSQSNDQVFINTHSSVFVADNCVGQTIFKVEKTDGETSFETISDADKPYVVFELLGGSPSDLLLPKNFLIVEGQTEFDLLSSVIKRFYSDKPLIQIIKANGDIDQGRRTINAIERAFTPLNSSIYRNKLVILIDKPSPARQDGVDQFLYNNPGMRPNIQFFTLPFRDIEQYYPDHPDTTYTNWKKTQAELDAVNANGKRIIDSNKKKQLAKHVGNNITQNQFETDLQVCFDALTKCWELAF